MRIITLLALLIGALSFRSVAQAGAPINQDLYQLLKRSYTDAAKKNTEKPILAFFIAANKTFQLGNDTTRRIFAEVEKSHPEMDDSAAIVYMLAPVVQQFLDSDYQRSVCPLGYEQAEQSMMNYNNYLCHCIPEQHEDMKRYDTATKLVEVISACQRAIRFNDSLKTFLIGGLNSHGIAAALLEPCTDAYVYSHCAHLRNTITRLCCEIALEAYRVAKTVTVYDLNRVLDYRLRSGDRSALPYYYFDNDRAALAMDQAAFWAGPELKRPYWQKIVGYAEVHNYANELVVTYLMSEGPKLSFLFQATYAIRWFSGSCRISGVYVAPAKRIKNKEQVLEGIRKMKEKTATNANMN